MGFATTEKTTKTGRKSASGYLQVAGVEYKTDDHGRITSMEVRSLTGKVLPVSQDRSSTWRIATSKYIADCIDTSCPMTTIARALLIVLWPCRTKRHREA